MIKIIHIGPIPARVVVPLARRACEHICFGGAVVDLIGYCVHWEVFAIIIAGKLAFVAGAVGIYILHTEETIHHG